MPRAFGHARSRVSTLNRVLAPQEKEIIETALEEFYGQVSGPSGAAKQAPHVWRYVVIEIIRDLPANLFATQGDHGSTFPTPRCLAHERETK